MRKLLILIVLCFAAAVQAQDGALALTEKQTVTEWESLYKTHRDAGREALENKDYDRAREEYRLAAAGTRFAWVRARMLANAGFAALLQGDKEGAFENYGEALEILEANPNSGKGKFSKERAKTKTDVEQGLSRCQ